MRYADRIIVFMMFDLMTLQESLGEDLGMRGIMRQS
jgi:hypothetical protein